jgi:hypothetical protein
LIDHRFAFIQDAVAYFRKRGEEARSKRPPGPDPLPPADDPNRIRWETWHRAANVLEAAMRDGKFPAVEGGGQ